MKIRIFLVLLGLSAFFLACQSKVTPQDPEAKKAGLHQASIQEVLQAQGYTYLRVKEEDGEKWLAIPSWPDAKTGTTVFYKSGMEMKKFESKDLKRTFESVWFLEGVSTSPNPEKAAQAVGQEHKQSAVVEKQEIKVEKAQGGITIAELYANKEKYAGKVVKITGKVTKFNDKIMNKNWIHIQDGTENQGVYDLTVTSDIVVAVGDKVTLEGKIALKRDFGYGYSYDVLMEDAVKK